MKIGSSIRNAVALFVAIVACTATMDGKSAADTAVSSAATLPTSEAGLTTALLSDSRPQVSSACKDDSEAGNQRGSDLAAAAKLFIKFSGLPDLTGEYRVDSQGEISVPVIGHVNVANTCVAALEQALGKSVSAVTRREVFTAVEISEYRSIFVTGYVMRPGAVPWRPGMNVLQSLAEAGGLFRAVVATEGGSMFADDILARWNRAVGAESMDLAVLARMESERKHVTSIDVPAKLVELIGAQQAKERIDEQKLELERRMGAHDRGLAALEREAEQIKVELKERTARYDRLNLQLQVRKEYKSKIEMLQRKGVLRLDRAISEYSVVADIEERALAAKAEMAGVEAKGADVERRIIKFKSDHRENIEKEIERLLRDIQNHDVEMKAARDKYRQMTGRILNEASSKPKRDAKTETQYKIVRRINGNSTTLASDELALLRPGDILVVNVE